VEKKKMIDSEKLAYELLLKDLKEASNVNRVYFLDRLEKFVSIVNIRINKAIPTGWEIP
jgi:hypothetical protein